MDTSDEGVTQGLDQVLGSAEGRFLESLPRKVRELRADVFALRMSMPGGEPLADLRRRMYSVYASSLVFRNPELAGTVKRSVDLVDGWISDGRALSERDRGALDDLLGGLPRVARERIEALRIAAREESSEGKKARRTTSPGGWSGAVSGAAPQDGSAAGSLAGRAPGAASALSPISLLILVDMPTAEQLRAQLAPVGFELSAAKDAGALIKTARSAAPDVIVVSAELAAGAQGGLLRALRADPMTDMVPLVMLAGLDAVPSEDADETLRWPQDAAVLPGLLRHLAGRGESGSMALAPLGDSTLEQVVERFSDELRRGLLEATISGKDHTIAMGEGSEVLAAAWSAVGRIRQLVSERSDGAVRFRELPRDGVPASLALVEGGVAGAPDLASESLEGRRILVADDDASVVWFFAGTLREAGAVVIEAHDGEEALQLARRQRPDVVISDILMPRLDGFGLCRALKRDPALSDVPVILISWKEDLLHRMRELASGADGYLLKEAGAVQVLGRVRDVLAPRARLEARLSEEGMVAGDLDGTGIVPVLRSTARHRPDASVTLRDAVNLLEVELRGGRMVALTRTAKDGTFVRGEEALPQLLGVCSGRFELHNTDVPVREVFDEKLDDVLQRGARRLGALLDAVSGEGLIKAFMLELDMGAFESLESTSPPPIRSLLQRLGVGESPAAMVLSGSVDPAILESVLLDLARRGALKGVSGPDGEDRVAQELEVREARPGTDLRTPLSIGPQPEVPDLGDPEATVQMDLDPSTFAGLQEVIPTPRAPVPEQVEALARAATDDPVEPEAESPPDSAVGPAVSEPDPSSRPLEEPEAGTEMLAEPLPSPPPSAPPQARFSSPPPGSNPDVTPDTPELASLPLAPGEPSERRLRRPAWRAMFIWLLIGSGLAGVGFLGERYYQSRSEGASPDGGTGLAKDGNGEMRVAQKPPAALAGAPALAPGGSPPAATLPGSPEFSIRLEDGGFKAYKGILDPTVEVAPDEGLLVVLSEADAEPAVLYVEDRKLGLVPAGEGLKLGLPEGIHRITLRRGARWRERWVPIRPGNTWVFDEPRL